MMDGDADKNLVCLDCSCQEAALTSGVSRTDHVFLSFKNKQLRNAKFLNANTFKDSSSKYKYALPTLDQFTDKMKQLGIGKDTTVVCYETTQDGKEDVLCW
mmetsp:Transcript_23953/g.36700  ORF Transcript_23953/g.36700 Transcript_23953/m.36700 type:complete len:101 (-) Transcript_23953:631-933(-)|eukprot:CAMPEP_0170483188 /NCGR_PEP_ID=MMETSP0208-20121228/2915_1 /TAXON_ID=197538 /ORGANISM="Strombidium inclinatum, Strain S3" /LENGTH=100 /DNA_ID=CAMNT_0010756133 /DNA_START=165 /DNA_END=467 /DNA_ORIENTATION=-